MKLLSVNIGQPQPLNHAGRSYRSGIHKLPVAGPVPLRAAGLLGDGQADRKAHGGPHRAVYCYGRENYDFWAERLGREDYRFGLFGENLTTLGLTEDQIRIGDILGIGGAQIQVSQPRVPCYKLADKLGIPGFEKTFLAANRPGFYARVLMPGAVTAGQAIELLQRDPAGLTVAEINAALHLDKDRRIAQRAAGIKTLSPEWRRAFEKLAGKS